VRPRPRRRPSLACRRCAGLPALPCAALSSHGLPFAGLPGQLLGSSACHCEPAHGNSSGPLLLAACRNRAPTHPHPTHTHTYIHAAPPSMQLRAAEELCQGGGGAPPGRRPHLAVRPSGPPPQLPPAPHPRAPLRRLPGRYHQVSGWPRCCERCGDRGLRNREAAQACVAGGSAQGGRQCVLAAARVVCLRWSGIAAEPPPRPAQLSPLNGEGRGWGLSCTCSTRDHSASPPLNARAAALQAV
jgi:hypothetical protein